MSINTKLFIGVVIGFIIISVLSFPIEKELGKPAWTSKIMLLLMASRFAFILAFGCLGAIWMKRWFDKKINAMKITLEIARVFVMRWDESSDEEIAMSKVISEILDDIGEG